MTGMCSYGPNSARVDGPPVPVHPDLAIAPEVITAARQWRVLLNEPMIRCGVCLQCVLHVAGHGTFSQEELDTSLLAHLMQRHEWTREHAGD
jgi:hypothetical protein